MTLALQEAGPGLSSWEALACATVGLLTGDRLTAWQCRPAPCIRL